MVQHSCVLHMKVSLAPQLAERQEVPAHPVLSFIPFVSQSVILTDTLRCLFCPGNMSSNKRDQASCPRELALYKEETGRKHNE